MADVLHGRATYPGLKSFISADYTVSHGTSPSLVSITFDTNQDINAIAPIGDVIFTDGKRTLPIKDCIAADLKLIKNDGYVYQMSLYDRRWKWQFGGFDGRFNERDNAGKIRPETKLSVHEIAVLLLKAMGEKDGSWDLGDLPNPIDEDQLPPFNWEAENPAKALSEVADAFNCRVVFQPITNRVLIAFTGSGKDLPDKDFTEYVPGMSKPVKPSKMEFVGGPLAFMAALLLDPMAEELDGSIVPLNDVSYKPVGGWTKGVPPFFSNVQLSSKYAALGKKLDDCKAAAKKSVWRYYRTTARSIDDQPFTIPGLAEILPDLAITEDWQVVPLDHIIGTKRDENRVLYSDPPKVYGEHYDGNSRSNNSGPEALVKSSFQVDSARGLVIFDNYVRKFNNTTATVTGFLDFEITPGGTGPADIVLVTSVYVRDPETRQVVRFRSPLTIAEDRDTPPQIVRREDIQYSHIVDYRIGVWDYTNPRDNFDEVAKAADEILTQADDYDRIFPESYAYPRIELIEPDGAISQVTWSVSGACSTRASRNGEHSRYVPPFKVQRGKERTDLAVNKLKGNLGDTLKVFGGLT
jgi:hypothetical protein